VLARPVEERHAAVLAFLADGESWSGSALALALGASQRTVQRALKELAAAGRAQSYGRGRARRWMTPPLPGFATTLFTHGTAPGRLGFKNENIKGRGSSANTDPSSKPKRVNGVSFDGKHVWFRVRQTGLKRLRSEEWQEAALARRRRACRHRVRRRASVSRSPRNRIQKIDPETGRVLATIPAPGGGAATRDSPWAEGTLWVGQYRERKIHQIDPETGAILRTIECTRFVTGVTWVDGEMWHGTWEGDESDLRRIDPQTGEVLERIEMPRGVAVSGLESNGSDQFFLRRRKQRQGEGRAPAQARGQSCVRTIEYYRWANIIFNAPLYPILLDSTSPTPTRSCPAA